MASVSNSRVLTFRLFKQLLLVNLILTFVKSFGRFFFAVELQQYTCSFYVRKNYFRQLGAVLRYHYRSRFEQLVELTCLDLFTMRHVRFKLVYVFLSIIHNVRLCCVQYTGDLSPVQTMTFLYAGANWQEREAWDLFGVVFLGHPDLRRILTDYGFLGHPLRKDFPLSGFTEVAFSDLNQLVIYQNVSLAQEFRDFGQTKNPWI